MERGSILKWIFLGLAIFLIFQFGLPLFTGDGSVKVQPLQDLPYQAPPADARAPETLCEIAGPRFTAQLSTRGASLRHVTFTEDKYKNSYDHTFFDVITGKRGKPTPIDLVTTTRESRMPLRTNLRLPSSDPQLPQQVAYDDFDWQLEKKDDKSCTFTFADATTSLVKEVSATERPFELAVTLSVKNLAAEPRKHRLGVEQTAWRYAKDIAGSLGMISEFQTETEVGTLDGKTHRTGPGDFEPGDFKDENFTAEKRRNFGPARWAATSSSYFTSALVPLEGPARPAGDTLVEEWWDTQRFKESSKDPQFGYLYRSRLAYPEHELQPQASVTYKMLSFTGPKEREVLSGFGGGQHGIVDAINLGWFGAIGKILISYVYFLHRLVGSWGWAIVLLTITVKMALFPLSFSQIRGSVEMRKLKPELDEINAKYKDDMAQRGLATQELFRKHGMSQFATLKGCIPVMLQMPVWFALYTALQTAVELYHTPFGPVIPDLSQPGKYYIIPAVLGVSSFIQQKLMPPAGDPQQQKMMQYMMPVVFTVMMLFLPAGLGVYMLTNTWLGITQQVLVERYMKAKADKGDGGILVKEKTSPGSGPKKDVPKSDDRVAAPALLETGKGKARVRG